MAAGFVKCPFCQFEIPASATVCGHCGASERWGFGSVWGLLLLVVAGLFAFVVVLAGMFAVLVMFYGGTRYQNPNTAGAFIATLLVIGIALTPGLIVWRTSRKKQLVPAAGARDHLS